MWFYSFLVNIKKYNYTHNVKNHNPIISNFLLFNNVWLSTFKFLYKNKQNTIIKKNITNKLHFILCFQNLNLSFVYKKIPILIKSICSLNTYRLYMYNSIGVNLTTNIEIDNTNNNFYILDSIFINRSIIIKKLNNLEIIDKILNKKLIVEIKLYKSFLNTIKQIYKHEVLFKLPINISFIDY